MFSFWLNSSKNRFQDTHIQLYITLFIQSEMIPIIYQKHSTSIIVIMQESYAKRIPWNNFSTLNTEFFINWLFFIFWLCNENLHVYFWERLIVYQKVDLLSEKIKIAKGCNSIKFIIFFLTFYACILLNNTYKKVLENRIVSELVYS